jgi:alanyl-tRNA synthetase
VQQKGSLVDPDKLRFDFSHGKSLADDEIARVETLVSERINQKLPVYAEVAPQEQALKIHGLRAVFGEKYPPMVRVVSIGMPVADLLKDPANTKWRQYSIEFCGGTHLKNTSDCEGFVIVSEESVSKGIRRIVAVTGERAAYALSRGRDIDNLIEPGKIAIRDGMHQIVVQVVERLQKRLAENELPLRTKRRGQAAVADFQSKLKALEKTQRQAATSNIDLSGVADDLLAKAPALGPGKLLVGEVSGATDEQLRGAMDSLRKKSPSHGILLGSATDGKVFFVAAVSDDLIAKGLKAGDWIRETAKVAGGGGGGKPQMAQAGGKDPSKLADALVRAREFAQSAVK